MIYVTHKDWIVMSYWINKVTVTGGSIMHIDPTPEQWDILNAWAGVIDGEIVILESAKKVFIASAIKKINKTFSETIAEVKKHYSEDEIESWQLQYTEALRVKNWETWTMLESILLEDDDGNKIETEEELADKIIANSEQYYSIYTPALKAKRIALKKLEEKYSI